ncbi:DUF881 domain-containing protein [Coprothermobacter proteolyticus]|uniref:DUF881 domain-containing protein n=1 Tax=Coprothermobacter proteolyticus TaxID=35786 RepID=UPI000D31BC72|nr:DUF881 domain-containing protein [Coprothermobacter proteolyticus]MBP8983124.1 DUF881 domain-containing protein [Coprothermobacter sp.]NLT83263.1 DUF881 domain-containing protein [Coprothermobacter proteolyticus]HOK24635.1 DUF881 domain-containing protein [Coprothermobacter proteolyticus]HOL53228.1 DUF881 domain-containing protein [Coprothermobacter proteolyticus]HPO83328.1 DUF881 domain-containing protein [Coprothermobacter proteolyticus]
MRNKWLLFLAVAIMVFVSAFGMGFSRSGQQVDLNSLSESDLAMLYAKSLDEINRLESAKEVLLEKLKELKSTSHDIDSLNRQQRELVARLESLSCDAPLTGSGITITVDVPEGAFLSWDWAITLVNNAYSAGALGVSVNNVRLSPKWYVYYESGQLFVEGKALTSPFVFDIVGEPESILSAMYLPSGVFDTLQVWGVRIEHELKPELTIQKCDR